MSKDNSEKPNLFTETPLGCLSIVIILGLIFYILFGSSFIAHYEVGFCRKAKSDAKVVAAHIADYFTDPTHTTLPSLGQLEEWKHISLSGKNEVTISGEDPNEPIIITVKDSSGKCPADYQNAMPNWDGNGVYKETILLP